MADSSGSDSVFAEPPDSNPMEIAHQEIRDVAGDPLDALDPVTEVREAPTTQSTGTTSMNPADEQTWSTLAHASGFVGLLGIPSFLGPMFVYLMKKEQSSRVRANAAEALNFHITMAIAAVVAAVTIVILIGLVLLPMVMLGWLVFTGIGSYKASEGQDYRYPINLRLIK